MGHYLIVFSTCIVFNSIYSQADSLKYEVTFTLSLEEHDKRLFDFTDKKELLAEHPEYFGTFRYALDFTRKIKLSQTVDMYSGMGFGYELSTFNRPFDHFYFTDRTGDGILQVYGDYERWLVAVPIEVNFKVNTNVALNTRILSNFVLHRKINSISRSNNSGYPYKETQLNFDSFELYIGIIIKANKLSFTPNVRLANIQKIDKIIFNYYPINDPRTDKVIEYNNHLLLGLSIGFML